MRNSRGTSTSRKLHFPDKTYSILINSSFLGDSGLLHNDLGDSQTSVHKHHAIQSYLNTACFQEKI